MARGRAVVGSAVASLVLGVLSLGPLGLLSLPAIAFGHVARRRSAAAGPVASGRGIALAGLVTGYAGLVFFLAGLYVPREPPVGTLHRLPSGAVVRLIGPAPSGGGTGETDLTLCYESNVDMKGQAALREEAEDVWRSLKPEAERRGVQSVSLLAYGPSKGIFLQRRTGCGFLFTRKQDGGWELRDVVSGLAAPAGGGAVHPFIRLGAPDRGPNVPPDERK